MTRKLTGRRLVVTGAARGIGENVARLAVARGAQVALIGLEPDRLRRTAEDLGPAASWCEADVRDGPALREAIDKSAALTGYKRPTSFVVVDAIAKNAVGKIDKVALRANHSTAELARSRG